MKKYNKLIDSLDYNEYLLALEYYHKECIGLLEEGIIDNLKGNIKKKYEFIKQVATIGKQKIEDIITLFKDSRVYKFFSAIGFSFKKLYSMLKVGYKNYSKLQHIIAEYVANTKVAKWTEDQIRKLDKYLQNHPVARKMAGPVISAILIYIWLNMAFSGDFVADFDFTDIINSAMGKFSLGDIFTGPEGIKLLTLFFIGAGLGLSFPWPGEQSYQLVTGVIISLKRMIRK